MDGILPRILLVGLWPLSRSALAAMCTLAMTAALLAPSAEASAQTNSATAPLQLEAKIPLGAVRGRIDHLAIDLPRHRLFVAELGNDSVGIVDLNEGRVIKRLTGFKEPQGIGYVPATDTFFVANGGDGSVAVFASDDLSASGRIRLGDDADNIRVDREANKIVVGYGRGALAVLDPKSRIKIADIALKAHPESFQLDITKGRIFVNVPNSREIAVVDYAASKQVGSWKLPAAGANFPMALDETGGTVITIFRSPAKMFVLREEDGDIVAREDVCSDADDVFVDGKRQRVYVSCGQGVIDVFEAFEGKYRRLGRITTVPGARTALFVAELDRLYLAVRASGAEPAAIWVYRPTP